MLESQFRGLQVDVTEIKSDVKSLVQAHTGLAQALAVREATDLKLSLARASTGVWIRAILPWVVAVAALVMAVINTFARIVAQ